MFVFAQAEEKDSDNEVPLGMEFKNLGGTRVLAPKDALVRKKTGMFVIEGSAEYAARKILELQLRLDKMDKNLEETKQESDELKRNIDQIKEEIKNIKQAIQALQPVELEEEGQ